MEYNWLYEHLTYILLELHTEKSVEWSKWVNLDQQSHTILAPGTGGLKEDIFP